MLFFIFGKKSFSSIRFKITRLLLHRVNYISEITVSNMGCTTAHHVRRNCWAQPKIVRFNIQRLWGYYISIEYFKQYWRHFFWRNWQFLGTNQVSSFSGKCISLIKLSKLWNIYLVCFKYLKLDSLMKTLVWTYPITWKIFSILNWKLITRNSEGVMFKI
jgi:hypothetical protein